MSWSAEFAVIGADLVVWVGEFARICACMAAHGEVVSFAEYEVCCEACQASREAPAAQPDVSIGRPDVH